VRRRRYNVSETSLIQGLSDQAGISRRGSGWCRNKTPAGQGQARQHQQTRRPLPAHFVHDGCAGRDPLCQDPSQQTSASACSTVGTQANEGRCDRARQQSACLTLIFEPHSAARCRIRMPATARDRVAATDTGRTRNSRQPHVEMCQLRTFRSIAYLSSGCNMTLSCSSELVRAILRLRCCCEFASFAAMRSATMMVVTFVATDGNGPARNSGRLRAVPPCGAGQRSAAPQELHRRSRHLR
jgi:hypothetical protein